MSTRLKFATMDEYFAAASPAVRPILEEIRALVKRTIPAAEETISYQMPAFKQGRVFFYFAAFKQHIGIYPPLHAGTELDEALLPYRGPKGNLKFPLMQPMPYALIERVAAALAEQSAP